MNQAELSILDSTLENAIRLERFSASERKKVLAILEQLQKDLRTKLLGDLTDFGKARVNKLLKESTQIIETAYKEIAPVIKTSAQGVNVISKIKTIIDADKSELSFGLRVIPKDQAIPKIGDVLKSSFEWVDGKNLGKSLGATSSIGIEAASEVEIRRAMFKLSGLEGEYSGNKVVLIRGTFKDIGNDPGEWLLKKPKVIEVFNKNELPVYKSYDEFKEALRLAKPKETLIILSSSDSRAGGAIIFHLNNDTSVEMSIDEFKALGGYHKAAAKVLETAKATSEATAGTDLLGLARHEATATAQTFAAIGLEASLPTVAVMKALASDTLLFGAPLEAWWAKQASDLSFRYANSIRQGITAGETLQQMIIRVFGSKRLGTPGIGFPDAVLRRNASTIVHDSIMTISNNARMAVYDANADILKGYRQLSALDSHTSKICMAYSGATWDMGLKPMGGTSLPYNGGTPRHPNCRSLTLPILKSYAELGAPDIPEPGKGTRASDLGQVDADLSFDGFLKRHSKNYQDDLLGPGRADLWRAGKLSLTQLVDGTGRELTLKQLKAA